MLIHQCWIDIITYKIELKQTKQDYSIKNIFD